MSEVVAWFALDLSRNPLTPKKQRDVTESWRRHPLIPEQRERKMRLCAFHSSESKLFNTVVKFRKLRLCCGLFDYIDPKPNARFKKFDEKEYKKKTPKKGREKNLASKWKMTKKDSE
ncbi:hypothetical protein TNCV_982811 [Trichonephila clavipes]|nr:hypothetical protein TNCV_982811 [Trichonephila clavipes]